VGALIKKLVVLRLVMVLAVLSNYSGLIKSCTSILLASNNRHVKNYLRTLWFISIFLILLTCKKKRRVAASVTWE